MWECVVARKEIDEVVGDWDATERLPIFYGEIDYMGLVSHDFVLEIKCLKCGKDNEWIEMTRGSFWGCTECCLGLDSAMHHEYEEAFCAEG